MPKTFTMPDSIELSFVYRTGGKDSEPFSATVVADLTGLEEKDLLEWAYSNMIIGYQSKLRGKKPPTAVTEGPNKGKYQWKVPARGSRSVADPAKLEEQAGKLLAKMDPESKFHVLVAAGLSEAMASQATGYTPPSAPAKRK